MLDQSDEPEAPSTRAVRVAARARRIDIWRNEVAQSTICFCPEPRTSIGRPPSTAGSGGTTATFPCPSCSRRTATASDEDSEPKTPRQRRAWNGVKRLARRCTGKTVAPSALPGVSSPSVDLPPRQSDEIARTGMYRLEGEESPNHQYEQDDDEGDEEEDDDEGESALARMRQVMAAKQARMRRAEKLLLKLNERNGIANGDSLKISPSNGLGIGSMMSIEAGEAAFGAAPMAATTAMKWQGACGQKPAWNEAKVHSPQVEVFHQEVVSS